MGRPMGRTLRILVPCALGLIAAFLVSCGDTSKLIPGDEAAAINQNVDAAAEASGSGRCGRADAAVARAAAHVQQLPSGVDPRLRADLEQGLARLRAAAATECAQNKEPTTTTETTPSTESTASTETQNTQTENTETQNTQTENTETQNTETQGTDTTGGSGGGGAGSGGGGAGSGGTSGGASNGQGSDGGNGGTAAP